MGIEPTEPERALLRASAAGRPLDLRTGDADRDDPATAADWPAERTIRAEFLVELLTTEPAPGPPRPVRLSGARITDRIDLGDTVVRRPLTLTDCAVEAGIDLVNADVPGLGLTGCHLGEVYARGMRLAGDDLNLDRIVAGHVNLAYATVPGHVVLDGAVLAERDGHSLFAAGTRSWAAASV